MPEITKEEFRESPHQESYGPNTITVYPEGYLYKMKGSDGYADVVIKVYAEIGGHGCLFGIEIPRMSIDGMCWSDSTEYSKMEDVFKVLNRVLEDYKCDKRVVHGFNQLHQV